MKISYINRKNTGLFTDISNRLSYNQDTLLNYINQPFSLASIDKQANTKSHNFSKKQRETLVDVLNNVYSNIEATYKTKENIQELLNSNTFTLTTGHQLSIFTGPIYFIYKILHTIRLTEELNQKTTDKKFIPVFWMASEDHDFEEIQSVNIFQSTLKWETEQRGPVGRFEMESFEKVKNEFSSFFDASTENEVLDLLKSYSGRTLSEATFKLINKLFGRYGLVILDGDNQSLKKEFASIMELELNSQFSFEAVNRTNQKLQEDGIKLQISPREINLFYIENNLRSRIQLINNQFFIEGKGSFSKEEILNKLEDDPSSFSPNVVLRPLYQEMILPNLCYLGGGGEIAYWLQLKGVFDFVNCTYPLIQVRNSIFKIDPISSKKIEKLNLKIEELFKSIEELKKQYVLNNSSEELNFTKLDTTFHSFCDAISHQINQIDPNLKNYSESEISKLEKQLLVIKQKLIKTEKNKHEQSLLQIEQLKNKLFPKGGLQERYMNFFSLCSDGKVYSHLDEIYQSIIPFGNDLIIIE